GSRSPTPAATWGYWGRCGRRSCTGWATCCGSASRSRFSARCSPGRSCRRDRRTWADNGNMSRSRTEQRAGKPEGGLRERKKAETRPSIRQHAVRLFTEQGYHQTTTEQIAAAAEIAPSSLFRYFPTKEETVLYDPVDPVLFDAFVAQPPELTPVGAMRAAARKVLNEMSEGASAAEFARQELIFSVPELRAAVFERLGETLEQVADALAHRIGKDPTD